MGEQTYIGVLAAIGAMFGYGMADCFWKKPVAELGPVRSIVFRNIVVCVFLAIILLFNFDNLNIWQTRYLLYSVCIAFFGYFGLFFYGHALRHGKIGIVVPICGISPIISTLTAILLYGETVSLSKWLVMPVIIIGIVLISIDLKDFKNSGLFDLKSGIAYAFLAAFFWGTTYAFFGIPASKIGVVPFALTLELTVLFMSIVNITLIKKETISVPKEKIKRVWVNIIGVSFGGTAGTLLITTGYKFATVSTVSSIVSATPMIALLYYKIVHKEKLTTQEYIAAVMIVTGVVVISFLEGKK